MPGQELLDVWSVESRSPPTPAGGEAALRHTHTERRVRIEQARRFSAELVVTVFLVPVTTFHNIHVPVFLASLSLLYGLFIIYEVRFARNRAPNPPEDFVSEHQQ